MISLLTFVFSLFIDFFVIAFFIIAFFVGVILLARHRS